MNYYRRGIMVIIDLNGNLLVVVLFPTSVFDWQPLYDRPQLIWPISKQGQKKRRFAVESQPNPSPLSLSLCLSLFSLLSGASDNVLTERATNQTSYTSKCGVRSKVHCKVGSHLTYVWLKECCEGTVNELLRKPFLAIFNYKWTSAMQHSIQTLIAKIQILNI